MFAFCQDMPGTTMEQQAVLDELIDASALDGCVIHVVGEYDGGVRMIDVWTDEAAYRKFQTTHLWPALDRAAPRLISPDAPPAAPFTILEVTGEARGVAIGT